MAEVILSALILLGILGSYTNVRAQDLACKIEGFNNNNYHINSQEIPLDYNGILEELSTTNTVSIVSTETEGMDDVYIDAVLTDTGTLRVFTTDKFKDYPKLGIRLYITLIIKFNCSSKQTVDMKYMQRLLPGNYFTPEFSQEEYQIKAVLPARPGSDLSEFMDVSAVDYDIKNNEIVYSSDLPELITVGTRPGDDNKTFHATLKLNEWLQSIPDKIEFTLTATDSGSPPRSAKAKIVVTANSDLSMPPKPAFSKALYKGSLDKQKKLEIEDIELFLGTYADDVQFKKVGGDSELFEIQNQKNIVKVKLARDLTDADLNSKDFLTFTLNAERQNAETGSTAIVVGIPHTKATPVFSKATYHGVLTEAYDYIVMPTMITVSAETYTKDIKYGLEGPDADFFSFQNSYNEVTLELEEPLSEDLIAGKYYLELIVTAVNDDGLKGSTTVLINIPNPIPGGPDENEVPVFNEKSYYYEVPPTYIGRIGSVYAKLPNSSASVYYSVQVSNAHLRARLQIMEQTGTLLLKDSVIPGQYSFTVVATNDVTDDRGTADATLSIREGCSWSSNTSVEYTLLIKSIPEEEEHKNLFDLVHYNCMFNLTNFEPNDQEYIKVDAENNVLTSIALDRESNIFSRMSVPQITVSLNLECSENAYKRAKRSTIDLIEDDSSIVSMKSIRYNPYQTVLTFLIEDVNDNPPVFVNPSENGAVVGYPEASVAAEILPESLIRVEASDKDSGLNAKIKYSISENDYFGIEPESGVVYPTSKAAQLNNDVRLTVWATDLDGAPKGLKTSVQINMKKILEEHLTLITVRTARIEDVKTILSNLSKDLNLDIRAFRAGIVPAEDNERSGIQRAFNWLGSFRASTEDRYSLKMWTYALDEKQEPVENDEFERRINDAEQNNGISAESYKGTGSHIGYIVTVSVLSIVVIILIALGFSVWWIFIRPYDFRGILSDGSGETVSSAGSVDHETRYKNSGSLEVDSSEYYEDKLTPGPLSAPFYHHRNSMNITGAHRQESDDARRKSETDNERSDGEDTVQNGSLTGRSKSIVTFNELVERIDIERVNSRNEINDGERL